MLNIASFGALKKLILSIAILKTRLQTGLTKFPATAKVEHLQKYSLHNANQPFTLWDHRDIESYF